MPATPTALLLGLTLTLPTASDPQAWLPPAPAWSGDSEKLIAAADDPWQTPAERMALEDTPDYAETLAYLRRLATASPLIHLQTFGKTAQGRELVVVIASREKTITPEALRASGKPVLLAQAGIHAGEIDGKDAGLMLLRDIALRDQTALLDHAHLLFVPVFNADGHERRSPWNRPNQRGPRHMGWRTTAQNLNLNRDYVKADAPEMRAMLELYSRWQPDLVLDIHVTDGIDYQYDITFGYNGWDGGFAYSPRIARWLEQHFRGEVAHALSEAGHIPGGLVFALNNRDLNEGLDDGAHPPRFSVGYGDLRRTPTVLVENHSLKPYRQRVLGTYVLLQAALQSLGKHAAALQTAIREDQAARPATLPMNWGNAGATSRLDYFAGIAYEEYESPASGTKEVRWTGQPAKYPNLPVRRDRAAAILQRPKAYWVPVSKPDVIERLRLHGIRMQTLTEPRTLTLQMYRLVDPKPSALPFEGRHTVTTKVRTETREETFPAGSVRIDTDQPLGDLAVVMLEPESDDSLLAWGFFPEILQRTEYIEGYVAAPMAEAMLREDPKLRAEFEAKLAAEPEFAADPQARLAWFYARSQFHDARYLLYPVGREP